MNGSKTIRLTRRPFFLAITLQEERIINSMELILLISYSYKRLIYKIQDFVKQLAELPPDDEFRISITSQLIEKLYNMGVLNKEKSLAGIENLTASSLCRYFCTCKMNM